MVQTRSIEHVVETYPLSPMQRGMLFHWLRDPRAGVDIEQISCSIHGVDLDAFKRAWADVTRRQPLLRTYLPVGRGGRPDAEHRGQRTPRHPRGGLARKG